jgi:hypothetical protein
MSSGKVGALITVAAVIIVGICIAVWGVGVSNTEIELREQAVAQEKDNQNIYQKVWTVIKQKAQVTDKYAEDFKGIYAGLMDSRYKGDEKDNPAFKWIHEQNPQLSVEMYKDLSDSIAGLRAEFARVQSRLIDIKREHDVLRKRFPSKLIVGGRSELEITIVTSAKTKETFKLGEENDVDVFGK